MKKSLLEVTCIVIICFSLIYLVDLNVHPLTSLTPNNVRESETGSYSSNVINRVTDIPDGWSYQKTIVLTPSTPSSDYNVKILLDPSNFDYSQTFNAGADIRFKDQFDTSLSYWIETWDQTGTSVIWVKVPIARTGSFYMYYGNPSATSESNGETTFLFFDDFPGTTIDSSKWTTDTDGSSTYGVSGGYVTLTSNTPNDWAASVMLGFNDFYINHGQTYGAKEPNGVTIGAPYGNSDLFQTKNLTTLAYEHTTKVIPTETWFTSDIRWANGSFAQLNNGTSTVTHTNSSTIPTIPLQVRLLTMNMYGGPGTWFGSAIRSIDSWGSGHALRARSWHTTHYDAPIEIRCDWLFVRKCTVIEPTATLPDVLTINTPEERFYNQPMDGFYPATYGFENEPTGTEGLNISFVDMYDTSDITEVVILEELDGHRKILKAKEASGWEFVYNNVTDQMHGTVEFWARVDDASEDQLFVLYDEGLPCIEIWVEFEQFNWRDKNDVSHVIRPCLDDTWYHWRIDFRSDNTFDFYLENVKELDNQDMRRNLIDGIDQIFFKEYDGAAGWYLDALGYSWDPGYNIGDNLNEGLLLSYITPIPLNWTGYSLNGETTITILGNTTISMPQKGSHTIQLFGNDSFGSWYVSEIRSFQCFLTPPNISNPNDFSIYYGDIGYSISWSVSGEDLTNYIVYRNGTIFDEGEWKTELNISLDGLEEGIHKFICIINNIWELSVSDEVWVTVLPVISETTSSTSTDTTPSITSSSTVTETPVITTGFETLTVLLSIGILILKSRRKKTNKNNRN